MDLKAAAKLYLSEHEKPFSHDRSLTVGASEIGACARRVWYEKKLGKAEYDPNYKPADGAAMRGDIIEDQYTVAVVRKWLASADPTARLLYAGKGEQRTFEALEWKLSATPDGVIVNPGKHLLTPYGVSDPLGNAIVVEMKSFDPRILAESMPKQQHIDQINVQMGLLRKEGTHTPAFGIIVYVNASFLDDVRVYPVFYDRLKFDNQIRRALQIMGSNFELQVRPEGKVAGGKECMHCPFAERCLGYTPLVPKNTEKFERLSDGMQERIMSAVGTVNNQRQNRKVYDTIIAEHEAEIRELLVRADTNRVTGKLKDGRTFQVTWDKRAPRVTWDSEALNKLLPSVGVDPEDYKKEGKESDTLTVKVFQREQQSLVQPEEPKP